MLNQALLGVLQPGLYRGFDFVSSGDLVATFNHDETGVNVLLDNTGEPADRLVGVIYTKYGVAITEDEPISLNVVTNGSQSDPRIDTVFCEYEYTKDVPGGNPATYGVIKGTNSSEPTAPALGNANQILIGYLYLPAGVTALDTEEGVRFYKALVPNIGNNELKFTTDKGVSIQEVPLDGTNRGRGEDGGVTDGQQYFEAKLLTQQKLSLNFATAFTGAIAFNGVLNVIDSLNNEIETPYEDWVGFCAMANDSTGYQTLFNLTASGGSNKDSYLIRRKIAGTWDSFWRPVYVGDNQVEVVSQNGTLAIETNHDEDNFNIGWKQINVEVGVKDLGRYADFNEVLEPGLYGGYTPVTNPGSYVKYKDLKYNPVATYTTAEQAYILFDGRIWQKLATGSSATAGQTPYLHPEKRAELELEDYIGNLAVTANILPNDPLYAGQAFTAGQVTFYAPHGKTYIANETIGLAQSPDTHPAKWSELTSSFYPSGNGAPYFLEVIGYSSTVFKNGSTTPFTWIVQRLTWASENNNALNQVWQRTIKNVGLTTYYGVWQPLNLVTGLDRLL